MNVLATTVTLTVIDPAASAGFLADHFSYRTVLSFDGGAAVDHPNGGPTLFFLREGLPTLAAAQRHQLAQGLTLALTVEDLEREVGRLGSEGIIPTTEIGQDAWGERHVQITDPNGVVIQLVEWVGERPY